LDEPPKLVTFRLDDPAAARLPLLDAFTDTAVEPASGLRHYLAGRWGSWRGAPWWPLTWADAPRDEASAPASPVTWTGPEDDVPFGFDPASAALSLWPTSAPASAPDLWSTSAPAWLVPSFTTPVVRTPAAIFASNGFDALWSIPPTKPVPNWRCRRRPVRMARYGGETDAFLLVRCDGSAAPQAFDRLTLMAREAASPRPGELLPDAPDPEALPRGEWSQGVRLVHPRLLWIMQRVADAFPWRTIYVFSGYRHDPSGKLPKPGSHHSMHSEARAMDIYVMGVPNASLFQVCHKLDDVGCGFYPNNKFVHVDVRRPGSGHPFWIDTSGPGEPSRYVDAWPGVVDGGGLVWDPAGKKADASRAGSELNCTPSVSGTRSAPGP
jgi:Peptidase M15